MVPKASSALSACWLMLAIALSGCASVGTAVTAYAGNAPTRVPEEIQIGFERHKAEINQIFKRHQRRFPGVGGGRIVVSITVAPAGDVTSAHVVSSTYERPALEEDILEAVKSINFGSRPVPVFTYPNYPINFVPS